MRVLKLLAMALAVVIAAIGLVGMVAPSMLIDFARSLETAGSLYVIGAVRVACGALLVSIASATRMPKTLRIIGLVILVTGLVTPFIGVERSRGILDWWSNEGSFLMRVWAGLAIVLGLLILFAVASPRRPSR